MGRSRAVGIVLALSGVVAAVAFFLALVFLFSEVSTEYGTAGSVAWGGCPDDSTIGPVCTAALDRERLSAASAGGVAAVSAVVHAAIRLVRRRAPAARDQARSGSADPGGV